MTIEITGAPAEEGSRDHDIESCDRHRAPRAQPRGAKEVDAAPGRCRDAAIDLSEVVTSGSTSSRAL